MNDKVSASLQLIKDNSFGQRCAALLSFGKDSMVMAHLIRDAVAHNAMGTHAFPMSVIYFREPWFPQKNKFVDLIIESWGMEVHNWSPQLTGIKVKKDMLELVSQYPFAGRELDIPKNVCGPEEYPRRDYLCGLNDWLKRPQSIQTTFPWTHVFHGHKTSDIDPFEGHVPITEDTLAAGSATVIFPLRDWTDNDVWDYIEEHKIPMQETRYVGRNERQDKWFNNDYIHACTRCIDPRNAEWVDCPKLGAQVINVSNQVTRFGVMQDYIAKARLKEKLQEVA